MDSMFAQCTKLQAIDISSFDMSKLGKDPNALSRMFDNCPSLERITVGDKCAVSFPEPGGSRTTGNWINTASNEIYAPINVPANVAATYESQLDVTQFPFFYNPDDVIYTGSPIEKKVTSTLKQGRDYTVAYANNTKVGTAAITIAGTGRYAGSMELPYDIVKATPSYPEVKGLTATCGQKLSDIALPEGFTWEGDASATIDTPGWPTYTATYTPTDTANYSTVSGIEVTVHATQPIDASMFSIEDTDIRYTGNPVMPTVTSSTVPSDQYTVTYENNVAIGQATAIVTANNQNYSGTCKIPFEIKPTNAAANYQHSTTAQSGDVILTVQWNDPKLGQETTFHVSATGGSGAYQFRMDAPTYMDPDGSSESVADPSRDQWLQYTGECASRDYQFEMTASGTYYLRFYLMDKTAGVYYLRANVFASANDDAYPAVSTIVKSAVDKCNAETDGSDYARTLWLHDWTLDQLEYDHDLNWCSAESGLTRHQGTCESYQRIYAKLLDAAGIANGRITGNGHTWNAVKIDGKWCQMDLTWDDTNDNWYGDLDQRHLYFGLTDELMAIAHSDHTKNYQAEGYSYRSTDLSNNYFVRNGKADEWAGTYADRIQQHLDARETEFSINADNQSFPPSISGIQNVIVAYAINQRQWNTADDAVTLTTTSNVTTVSSYEWLAKFDFEVEHPVPAPIVDVSQADIAVADVKYTGVAMEPATTVALNGTSLKQGIDYIATYSDNVTPGTAEVVISGIGNYTGTIRKTFEITASDAMTEFVSGLYAGGTNRRADADGFAYWLYVTKELGYESAAVCFLSSSEVASRSQTSEALISVVFNALLGREADVNERARWTSSLESGTTPSDFVRTITSSREFVLNHPSITIEEFVENMYREALGRPSDKEGFAYWTSAIVDQTSARNAIEAAFASTEFGLGGLSPEETVRKIYRSALLREPDKGGLEYYSGLIENGATPLDIARQATHSQEFEMICTKCGLR